MTILIVESNPDLSSVWANHLKRCGAAVLTAESGDEAIDIIKEEPVDAIVLDLSPKTGCAITVADFASYFRPNAKVIFVTKDSFFSDGSIFNHVPNAAAMIVADTPPSDLAAIIEHHTPSALNAPPLALVR